MNWYIVKIIYRIISGNGNHTAQFDEQLRLISAANQQAAFEKGNGIGTSEQSDFLNEKKERVTWEFIAVTEVNLVNSLEDGAELYYNIHETGNAALYIETAKHRSDLLANRRVMPISLLK
ncbi:MAG: DUF4288 domain-containing protein [Bacteroidota bacterium]